MCRQKKTTTYGQIPPVLSSEPSPTAHRGGDNCTTRAASGNFGRIQKAFVTYTLPLLPPAFLRYGSGFFFFFTCLCLPSFHWCFWFSVDQELSQMCKLPMPWALTHPHTIRDAGF
ncbi:hypothetical protein MHYP_G00111760 [Metynnis hypsauchen]